MTVHEIAKLANVSIATVSRVLNGTGTVKPETAEVVRRVVQDFGSRFDRSKVRPGPRQGSGKRGHGRVDTSIATTIAIASIGLASGPWFAVAALANALAGITSEASDRGLVLQMEDANSADELGERLRSRGVSGALVFLPSDRPMADLTVLARYVPVVRVLGESLSADGIDHITLNNVAIGALAADYLIDQHCSRLALFTQNPTWDINSTRAYGFRMQSLYRGFAEAPATFYVSNSSVDSHRFGPLAIGRPTLEAAIDALLETNPRPTGLFIPRDLETVVIQRALQERGIVVGRDLKIASCDASDALLMHLNPPPATIDPASMEVGRLAVKRLLARIRNPQDPAVRIEVTPRLKLAQ